MSLLNGYRYMKKPDFSIVFPVMNQEDHIQKVLVNYQADLELAGFYNVELIPVVNGSTDRTYEKCRDVAYFLPNVKVYNLKEHGYGLGILYGLSKATGKNLCYLNCARIHSPDLIRCLQYFNVDKKALVHGIRVNREEKTRRIGSLFYNLTIRAFFHVANRDINGNPNVFSRKIYEKLMLKSKDSMIDLEMLEKAKKLNIPVVEVPVLDYTRHGGHSTTKFSTVFRLLKEMIGYWFSDKNPKYKVWCTFCGYPATLSKWKDCEYYKQHKKTPVINYL